MWLHCSLVRGSCAVELQKLHFIQLGLGMYEMHNQKSHNVPPVVESNCQLASSSARTGNFSLLTPHCNLASAAFVTALHVACAAGLSSLPETAY